MFTSAKPHAIFSQRFHVMNSVLFGFRRDPPTILILYSSIYWFSSACNKIHNNNNDYNNSDSGKSSITNRGCWTQYTIHKDIVCSCVDVSLSRDKRSRPSDIFWQNIKLCLFCQFKQTKQFFPCSCYSVSGWNWPENTGNISEKYGWIAKHKPWPTNVKRSHKKGWTNKGVLITATKVQLGW